MTELSKILENYPSPEKVKLRNPDLVNKLIQKLVHDGREKMQVITDFDYTLSKHHTKEGNPCHPAAGIIKQSPLMSEEFKARARVRFNHLLPIELDPLLSIEEKTPHVIASFQEAFADIISSKVVTKKSLADMISNIEKNSSFQLRDRCPETLQHLHESNVPVLIFSAGYGDIIEGVLKKERILYPNVHIVGNFMEFDEHGQLLRFKEPLIHTFNKNESVIPKDCSYFKDLAGRRNIILLGDSIGDVSMAQGVQEVESILKIGFLNEMDEKQLEIFLQVFDIVLVDDQTMDFVNCLLKLIC